MKERNSSFEMLRLVAMFIIIAHHFVVHGLGWKGTLDTPSINAAAAVLSGWGGYLGNSLFMLLTGYFSITKNVSWKRLLLLMLDMTFYAIGIAVLWKVSGMEVHGWKNIIFPYLYGYNWFVACYLIFMCFVPYLNVFLNNLNKEKYIWGLLLFFAVYNIFPALGWKNFINGAPILQFFLMYSIGGYLRLYGFHHEKLRKYFTWGLLTVVFIFLQDAVLLQRWLMHKNIWQYVNVISTFLAVSMFMFAASWKPICVPWVNRLSASVLGVYLIHDNPLVRPFIWTKVLPNVDYLNESYFILFFLVKVLCVYALCLIVDQIRLYVWAKPWEKWINAHWDRWTLFAKKVQMKWGKVFENI